LTSDEDIMETNVMCYCKNCKVPFVIRTGETVHNWFDEANEQGMLTSTEVEILTDTTVKEMW